MFFALWKWLASFLLSPTRGHLLSRSIKLESLECREVPAVISVDPIEKSNVRNVLIQDVKQQPINILEPVTQTCVTEPRQVDLDKFDILWLPFDSDGYNLGEELPVNDVTFVGDSSLNKSDLNLLAQEYRWLDFIRNPTFPDNNPPLPPKRPIYDALPLYPHSYGVEVPLHHIIGPKLDIEIIIPPPKNEFVPGFIPLDANKYGRFDTVGSND